MKHLLFIVLFAVTIKLSAQDSIIVMHYNLLNYGNYTQYCTNSNNSHLYKEGYLRTIFGYVKPQIFTANEVSNLNFYHERLLTEVVNADGRSTYKRAPATNTAGSDIINMMFYDTTVLTLKSTTVIQSLVRDVDLYRLYFKNSKLLQGDTIFLNCIVAHLKAGDGNSDRITRGEMTNNITEWLNLHAEEGNYLIMGDFNLYTSEEPAYQNLTTVSAGNFIFYDPINTPGDWNNNPIFANVHTQSVTSTGSGCQASGGMDDRFDFILASDYIIEGSSDIQYKSSSYKAIGQDGKHFNQSITNLPNNSVPPDVLTALGKMSDHLPVKLTLNINAELPWGMPENPQFKEAHIYKVSEEQAVVQFSSIRNSQVEVRIYSVMGQLMSSNSYSINKGFNSLLIPVNRLGRGLFLFELTDETGNKTCLKLVL